MLHVAVETCALLEQLAAVPTPHGAGAAAAAAAAAHRCAHGLQAAREALPDLSSASSIGLAPAGGAAAGAAAGTAAGAAAGGGGAEPASAAAAAAAAAATPLLTAEHVAALEGSWRHAAQLRAELVESTAALAEGERQLVSPLLSEMGRLCAAEGAAAGAVSSGWLEVAGEAGAAAEATAEAAAAEEEAVAAEAAAAAAAQGSAEAAAVVGCVEGAVVQLLLSLQGLHQLCTSAAPASVTKPDESREDGGAEGEEEDEASSPNFQP